MTPMVERFIVHQWVLLSPVGAALYLPLGTYRDQFRLEEFLDAL